MAAASWRVQLSYGGYIHVHPTHEKLNTIKGKELILMVTHQVVIAQITGISPSSGGMVLYSTLNGKSKNIVINYK